MRTLTLLALAVLLSACIGGEAPRFAVEPTASLAKHRSAARTIMVADVSLPVYARESRITVQNETGALVPLPDADWADEPERAMTYALVRHLSDISGAKVAADPWPLDGLPEAEVRVRVERMVVEASGTLTLSGQFAVRSDDAVRRNRIEPFTIAVAAASQAPSDVLRAHEAAWQDLAELIARTA